MAHDIFFVVVSFVASMASIHLAGCGLAGKRSLPCFDGLRISQPAFGVSSSLGASGAILDRRCFRGLVVKAATLVAPKVKE